MGIIKLLLPTGFFYMIESSGQKLKGNQVFALMILSYRRNRLAVDSLIIPM